MILTDLSNAIKNRGRQFRFINTLGGVAAVSLMIIFYFEVIIIITRSIRMSTSITSSPQRPGPLDASMSPCV